MRKLKKTCKKDKGLKARIKREEFLDRLKNPTKYVLREQESSEEILARIRARSRQTNQPIIVAKQQPKLNITMGEIVKVLGMIK